MGGIACAMLLVGGLTALQQAAVLGLGAVHVRARRRRVLLGQGAARGDAGERRRAIPTGPEPATEARPARERTREAAAAAAGRSRPSRRWLALPAACGDANDERDASSQPQGATLRVTLGTQEFPEARILGELWRQALAVNGYAVDLRKGVGPAEDLDEALKDGDIDGYVAYTGTVLSVVAGEEVIGPRPGRDLRRGQGVLRRPGHGHERDDAVREQGRHRHHERVRRGRTTSPTIGDLAGLELVRARRPARVRGPAARARRAAGGLRARQRDVRAGRARPAVRRPRRRRPPTRSTPSPPTRSSRPATTRCSTTPSCSSAPRTSSWSCGEDKLDSHRRRRVPARRRRGQPRADRGGHGADERRGHRRSQRRGGGPGVPAQRRAGRARCDDD